MQVPIRNYGREARARKLSVADRRRRSRRPIVDRIEARTSDPPDVQVTVSDPLDVLYKRHVGENDFNHLLVSGIL